MGYCMQQKNCEIFMKAEDKSKVLQAIKDLQGKESISDSSGHHFSWVDNDFYKAETFEEIMEAWGWCVSTNDFGDVTDIEFVREKLGDDETLFSAIAPFVKDGSFIEMIGEDGDRWKWVFTNGELKESKAQIVWE